MDNKTVTQLKAELGKAEKMIEILNNNSNWESCTGQGVWFEPDDIEDQEFVEEYFKEKK